MTASSAQRMHSPSSVELEAEKMTQRLGKAYQEICEWAVENGHQLAIEIAYHILGLSPQVTDIGNLVYELSHPESMAITSQWSEEEHCSTLASFASAVKNCPKIDQMYRRVGHRGGAAQNRAQYNHLRTKTFLLALITNPLADEVGRDSQLYLERRRLRIWLLLQASYRLTKYRSTADKKISAAARFLILDDEDKLSWMLVDDLLMRARASDSSTISCGTYSLALIGAASALLEEGRFPGKTNSSFLNAIKAIALGETHPVENDDAPVLPPNLPKQPHLNLIKKILGANNLNEVEQEGVPLWEPSSDEDSAPPQLVYVDSSDSDAEQILSSGSVFLQSMEMAHNLPWSWDRPLPPEEKALFEWLSTCLKSSERINQLGATCVWVALQLGRSLEMVGRIGISNEATEEWCLDTGFVCIQRLPPRRNNHWAPSSNQERERVAPFLEENKLILPHEISCILQAAVSAEAPPSLAALWDTVASNSLSSWFGDQMKPMLHRLTSAKLAGYQSQRIFDLTGDFHLARLFSSHPNSALPGAYSYDSWDVKEIEKGLELRLDISDSQKQRQFMGSLLVPMEKVLCTQISLAVETLEKAKKQGLVRYHNMLAQYAVTAIYAGTGARPLKDPFESLQHFSYDFTHMFINDKDDGGLHSGRLVPLPRPVAEILEVYTEHLLELLKAVCPHNPALAQKITQQLQKKKADIPLFFLLDENLNWHSMTDAEKLNCSLFDWGLPTNLFRHRYVQRLRLAGVNLEVIEGWMGHAERGVATYSDYSIRCWQQDAERYVDELQQIFESLPFVLPTAISEYPTLLKVPSQDSSYVEPLIFGVEERKQKRSWRIKRALKHVNQDIKLFLKERPIVNLTEEELRQLGTLMLLRENGMPHPHAAIRYRVYLKQLKHAYDSHIAHSKNSKKDEESAPNSLYQALLRQRLVQPREEYSYFTSDVIQAQEQFLGLQEWSESTANLIHPSHVSKSNAAVLGTMLLAIESRIGYQKMLQDTLNGINFRLVQNKAQVYIEYSEILASEDYSTAVQRHKISYKAGCLLGEAAPINADLTFSKLKQIPLLQPILVLYNSVHPSSTPSITELLAWICRVNSLTNKVQMPGVLAASQSERLPPTSETLRDHTRILHGLAIELPGYKHSMQLPSEQFVRVRGQEQSKIVLQENALQFTKNIRAELAIYEPNKASEHAKNIQKICADSKYLVSPAMIMLGNWIAHIVQRGKAGRHRKFNPYQQESIATYWSSLAPVFQGLLYMIDLIGLDSEDTTEICAQMLEVKLLTSRQLNYFSDRLQSFFRWAKPFGVSMPEWSELALESKHRSVSPGLILENEYQTCLKVIRADEKLSEADGLLISFVLLTSYRFGLRAQEAICLLRRDWCQTDDYTWVLVQSNDYRPLKSKASRRAVPLLFELSTIEQDIIKRTLARYQSIESVLSYRPILCEPSGEGKPVVLTRIAPRISETLIEVLRGVTSNPELVLHHCRHTFYNRVAVALFELKSPLARKLCPPHEHKKIQKIVLGEICEPSRRSTMALARLMGHRYPSTGLKHYFHLATAWVDEIFPVKSQRTHKIKKALQLTELNHATPHVYNLTEKLRHSVPTLTKALQYLRLVSLGVKATEARDLIRLDPDFVSQLDSVFEKNNSRIRFTSSRDNKVKVTGEHYPNALLESITDNAWQRLLHRAEEIDKEKKLSNVDVSSLSSLQDLSYLVSPNRQILMKSPGHYDLVKLALDLFQVPSSAYQVYVKGGSVLAHDLMQKAGFVAEEVKKAKLDGISITLSKDSGSYRLEDYAGVVMSRQGKGVIRNGLDLAVAILAIGAVIMDNSTEANGHLPNSCINI